MEQVTDFYCRTCRKDFRAEGHRGYMNKVHKEALLTACPSCERVCYRTLSSPKLDPFYGFSRRIQLSRNKYRRDIMQADDPLFDLYFPQQKRERIEKENREERELWRKRKLGY